MGDENEGGEEGEGGDEEEGEDEGGDEADEGEEQTGHVTTRWLAVEQGAVAIPLQRCEY